MPCYYAALAGRPAVGLLATVVLVPLLLLSLYTGTQHAQAEPHSSCDTLQLPCSANPSSDLRRR